MAEKEKGKEPRQQPQPQPRPGGLNGDKGGVRSPADKSLTSGSYKTK